MAVGFFWNNFLRGEQIFAIISSPQAVSYDKLCTSLNLHRFSEDTYVIDQRPFHAWTANELAIHIFEASFATYPLYTYPVSQKKVPTFETSWHQEYFTDLNESNSS